MFTAKLEKHLYQEEGISVSTLIAVEESVPLNGYFLSVHANENNIFLRYPIQMEQNNGFTTPAKQVEPRKIVEFIQEKLSKNQVMATILSE